MKPMAACVSGRPVHTTIGAAVMAATPGGTILVCERTYAESVTVTTPGLLLRSQGARLVAPAAGVSWR
jgi:hypothetical protein